MRLSGDNTFQSSSKMSGDPKDLLADVAPGVKIHADIVAAYGYNMPLATLGSHAWLRDSLADAGENEPGNMQPEAGKKIPGKDT